MQECKHTIGNSKPRRPPEHRPLVNANSGAVGGLCDPQPQQDFQLGAFQSPPHGVRLLRCINRSGAGA